MTPKQIAAIRAEFAQLQEQLQSLDFPNDLVENTERLTEGLNKSTEALHRQAVAHRETKREIEALSEKIRQGIADEEEFKKVKDQLREARALEAQQLAAQRDALEQFNETLNKNSDELKHNKEAQDKYNEAAQAYEDHLNGMPDAYERYIKAVREANKSQAEFSKGFAAGKAQGDAFLNSVLGVSGGLGTLGKALAMGDEGMAGFAVSILDAAKSGKLWVGVGLKIADLSLDLAKHQLAFALEQDKAIANFRKATGAGKEFNNEIRQTERRLFAMGVSTADAANATQNLKNTMVDFTSLSADARDAVRDQTLMLERLGLSQQTSAQIQQIASQSMNMGWKESNQLLLDITSTARTLGIDVDKMGQEFVANKEFIVSFGKDGSKVFEEMAVQAKSLGMELGTLTGVVDKFTTFDDAGRHVGRLNAILGGPFLNSIDMMNAAMEDPAEAVKMLRDSFDQAGASMEDMGRAEKMAFASALGMSVEDMTNMMGKSNEEMEIMRIEQEELAEQARQTQTITEQLTSAMNAFYIQMGPVIDDILVPFIAKLADITTGMAQFFQGGGAMKAFFTLLGAMFLGGIGMAIGMAYAMNTLTAAIPFVGPALAAMQRAAMGPIIKKSLAAVAIGIGAGLVGGILGNLLGGAMGGGGTPKLDKTEEKKAEKRSGFARGGVVSGTTTAIVGEQGPEMVEMPIGSRVTNAPATLQLTNAIKDLSRKLDRIKGPGNVAVYIGDKQVTDVVLKAIDSPQGARLLGAYGSP